MFDTVQPHILAVDDDPAIRGLIADYLPQNDLRVSVAATGTQMREVLANEAIDLLLLDLRLPGEDGLEIAQQLRSRTKLPIIILTGKVDEADRVMGLELGADDYLTKPFSLRELLARIHAVLRRYRVAAESGRVETARAYRFGGWELRSGIRRLVSPTGERVELTPGEFNLLVAFLAAPQRILTRDQLLEMSRVHDGEVYDRSIDVQILRLRRKLEEDAARPRFIRTERGAGYVFSVPVELLR